MYLLLILLLLAACNLFLGSVNFPASEIVAVLLGNESSEVARIIVCESRLPELVVAILAGGALAVAGLVMQTVFTNPLADPSLLGAKRLGTCKDSRARYYRKGELPLSRKGPCRGQALQCQSLHESQGKCRKGTGRKALFQVVRCAGRKRSVLIHGRSGRTYLF